MSLARQIGARQFAVLEQAERGSIMAESTTDNARWCAIKRLVKRGYLARHNFGSKAIGFTLIYSITADGRRALVLARAGRHIDTTSHDTGGKR